MTSPIGGCVVNATYSISTNITTPNTFTNQSMALEASLKRNKTIAITALMMLPVSTLTGNKIFNPKPQPLMLPILKAKPPRQINTVKRCPLFGITVFANSDAF